MNKIKFFVIVSGLILGITSTVLAQDASWKPGNFPMAVISTIAFGLIGIVLAIGGFKLFDLLTPGDLEKEIFENQNMAAAILSGAMVIGICLIVAMAVL